MAESKVFYLLSEEKSGGKDKFFKGFGFSVAQWEIFRDALFQHGQTHEISTVTYTSYGTKYILRGNLNSPDGRQPDVQTVWQIDHEQTTPYLVTAYPT